MSEVYVHQDGQETTKKAPYLPTLPRAAMIRVRPDLPPGTTHTFS